MPGIARLCVNLGVAVACAGLGAAPAWAVTPSPPPGAPAVESAPPSLVGLDPELPPGVIAASAAAGSHWTPERAIYGTASTNDIAVKGAGGTTIRVDEIYPTTASGAPAKGPFPVLLTMTPYGKGQGGSTSPGSAASPGSGSATGGPDNYLAQRGYIEVVEDVRGTGDSNGSWGLFDPVQQQDAIKVLKWAAHLPHSDGRVGTYGPSYLGIDQLLLAGAVGPHSPLKAIFPMVSANDIYRDTSFMGGLLDFEFAETYLGLTGTLNTTNPLTDTASDPTMLSDLAGIEADHANGLATYHAASTANVLTGGDEAYDGSYWQARNPQSILARVVANHIPAYLIGGEFDIFQNGEPVNYAGLQNAWDGRSTTAPMLPGQSTTGRYQLIVGPWEHLNGSSVDVDPLELEWFDTWLKHERTGMGRTPTPLHYYDLGSGQFDETSTYPFTGSTPVRLYFGAGGTLTTSAPAPTASSPVSGVLGTVLGAAPVPVATGDTLVWSPTGTPCGRPIDQWSMGGISVPFRVGGSARAVRERRSGLAGGAVGDHLHQRSAVAVRDRCGTGHRHRLRERHHLGDRARGRARGRHSERRLLSAHRRCPSRLAARGGHAPVLGRGWHDDPAVPPIHAGVGQARDPGRRDRVSDPDLPDARDDRGRKSTAPHALDRRCTAPHAVARAAPRAGRRRLHDRSRRGRSIVAHGRPAQVASIDPGSAGTSTAYCSSTSSGTMSRARSWVAASTTKAATPCSCARSHAWVVTHQRSPGFSPGKSYSGAGELKSLPMLRWKSRNSALTTTQTVWLPRSPGPVRQDPSR